LYPIFGNTAPSTGDRLAEIPALGTFKGEATIGHNKDNKGMARIVRTLVSALCIALSIAGTAKAASGNYHLDGGTPAEQATVDAALDASSFDWSLVPGPVTIHIVRSISVSQSTPGQTWLDADLLDSGRFSWGVVQMEYAQQVQFQLLDATTRATLTSALGASDWCYEVPGTPQAANGCERFAATLAWAYWPSPQNSVRPTGKSDLAGALPPAAFRTLVAQLLDAPQLATIQPLRTLALVKQSSRSRP
jgi:hypothetical protein